MHNSLKLVTEKSKELAKQGTSTSDVILYLRQQGTPIIVSIKIVREVDGLPLAQAKAIVARHPAWQDVAEAGDLLHKELSRMRFQTENQE